MHKNNTLYSHEEGALTCLHITKCMQNLTSETCQNEDVAEFTASCTTLLFKRYRHRFTSLLHHQKHGFVEVHSFFSSKITSEDKPNHLMDLEEAFLSLKERQSKISVYWVECKVSDTFWRMKFPHKMTLLEKEKPKIIWSAGTFCTDQMTTSLSLLVRKLISSDPVIFIAKT